MNAGLVICDVLFYVIYYSYCILSKRDTLPSVLVWIMVIWLHLLLKVSKSMCHALVRRQCSQIRHSSLGYSGYWLHNIQYYTQATCLTSRNEMMEIANSNITKYEWCWAQSANWCFSTIPQDPMSQFTIVMCKYLNSVFVKTQDFKH